MDSKIKINTQPQPTVRQIADQASARVEHAMTLIAQQKEAIEVLLLRTNQQQQTIDQYRVEIYNLQLRSGLMTKMLEEKGIFAKEEFEKRWPLYLKSEVGIIGENGVMEGTIKITHYEGK